MSISTVYAIPGVEVERLAGTARQADAVKFGVDAAVSAWARLLDRPTLEGFAVMVAPVSPLGRAGWISVLSLGSTVTVAVPTASLLEPVTAAFDGLSPREASRPDVVAPRVPGVVSTIGPALLFYPPEDYDVPHVEPAHADATSGELRALLDAAAADEIDESGLEHIDSSCFASRTRDGSVASVCAYTRWPNGVAHISVLTRGDDRGSGHATRASTAAVASAIDEGLLPQWRARPVASQRVAARLGLVCMGAQFMLEPAGEP